MRKSIKITATQTVGKVATGFIVIYIQIFFYARDQSASPVQREADSTEARQVSEYMKKIKSFFVEHRTRSEFQSLKRSRMSSSSDEDADDDDDEEYFKQQAERRKKHKAYTPGQGQPRRYMTARSTMPVVVTKMDDRPLPSRSNH
ncbi:hypothetical protein SFRURICE_006314 [Spodoptera frugiperda]|nr:hypothetical protein SFRURICE_006314 [Spodoptera frugiperda]